MKEVFGVLKESARIFAKDPKPLFFQFLPLIVFLPISLFLSYFGFFEGLGVFFDSLFSFFLFNPIAVLILVSSVVINLVILIFICVCIQIFYVLFAAQITEKKKPSYLLLLRHAISHTPRTSAALVICSVLIFFGFLLFIVPGIFLFLNLFFVLPFFAFQNPRILEGIRKSWRFGAKNKVLSLKIILFLILPFILLQYVASLSNTVFAVMVSIFTSAIYSFLIPINLSIMYKKYAK